MPLFQYQAANAAGEIVRGTLDAESASQVVLQVEAQGLTIQSIGRVEAGPPSQSAAVDAETGEGASQELLRQHLAVAMERAGSVLPALRAMVAELPRGARRRRLAAFVQILESKDTASAGESFPQLSDYWIPLLSSTTAEDAGQALRKFVREWQHTERLNESSRLTFVYVWLVLMVTVVVMYLLSSLVIPTYRRVFLDFGLRLQPLTQGVLTLAEWIASGRILLVAGGAAAVILLAYFLLRGLPSGLRQWFGDRFGSLLSRSAALARFTRFTADLLDAELPAGSAVRIAGAAARSQRLSRAATRLARALERGQQDLPTRCRAIPVTVVHAVTALGGTATGSRLLRELSQAYAERGLSRTSWSRGIVEPLAIVLVGLLVGGVVIALFMPLISLTQGLS